MLSGEQVPVDKGKYHQKIIIQERIRSLLFHPKQERKESELYPVKLESGKYILIKHNDVYLYEY